MPVKRTARPSRWPTSAEIEVLGEADPEFALQGVHRPGAAHGGHRIVTGGKAALQRRRGLVEKGLWFSAMSTIPPDVDGPDDTDAPSGLSATTAS
ncbi:hypothetical protein ACGFWG_37770 [Streptomyces sp. NPDC048405]|uniref:hypothetical protein n=1 Tax=Streptomyces TaxID=1883 RepID=UPI000D59356A|nr:MULTISPECIES: hypothetical protein [Streptomyces]MBU6534436.1 hypothetical protein [Streptomyces sp. A108]